MIHDAKHRVSNANHWRIYHRACDEKPEMVEAMYETIKIRINDEAFRDSNIKFPNSTWLGSEILSTWKYKDKWNAFCGTENVSGALFGEIMWTAMYDDERDWGTTRTSTTNPDREERVYWLMPTDKA